METRDLACTEDLLRFIDACPVSFVAVNEIVNRLESSGYRRYSFSDGAPIPGGKYYLTRNGSSVLAFRLPEKTVTGFMISAAHCDSPSFQIKNNYAVKACDRYLKLDTEVYGGGIYASWFDRPLSVAGRAVVRTGDELTVRPFALRKDLCLIPNVCIHFNRDINSGYKFNPAVDTLPLFSDWTDENVLYRLIAEQLGVEADAIVSTDLYLYNRMKGTVYGAGDEFFAAPRIDDLQCAYATLTAFLESKSAETVVPVCAIFDNEEVGSSTKQGAAGDLLEDLLTQIAAVYGRTLSELLSASLLLSCDNAHAMHPNHPELTDSHNSAHMNAGIVIKHNANQKYTTDAVSQALFTEICKKADVPVQHYANRSDIAGGSTLGRIAATRVSMNAIDIGLAQLAMHSSYETAGTKDTAYLIDAAKAFFAAKIACSGDKTYRIIW